MSALLQKGMMFFHDRLREVPRQDQQIVGSPIIDRLSREDGKMVPRAEQILLQWTVVDDKIQHIPKIKLIEQSGGFGRSSIGRKAFVL